jgi:hypothetical protein
MLKRAKEAGQVGDLPCFTFSHPKCVGLYATNDAINEP